MASLWIVVLACGLTYAVVRVISFSCAQLKRIADATEKQRIPIPLRVVDRILGAVPTLTIVQRMELKQQLVEFGLLLVDEDK